MLVLIDELSHPKRRRSGATLRAGKSASIALRGLTPLLTRGADDSIAMSPLLNQSLGHNKAPRIRLQGCS